ncbi:MAG: glycosyltransferase family 2 protein [Elusimicrobia bacterium]|nr:glycosyltransferase family 2 protein [Elusimicrobiota bacterium]
MPTFSIILPFYNEEAVVERVIGGYWDNLSGANLSFEMILVNNGSQDKTPDILADCALRYNEHMRVVHVEKNKGYGWGLINGASQAKGDWLVTVPGDGEMAGSDLVRILQRVQESRADAAKGWRVSRSDGLFRGFVSALYNLIFRLIFWRVRAHDINGWPKVVRRDLWRSLGICSKDWFIDAELILKLAERGIGVLEVPFSMKPRLGGASHVTFSTVFEFLTNFLFWKITAGKPWKSTGAADDR